MNLEVWSLEAWKNLKKIFLCHIIFLLSVAYLINGRFIFFVLNWLRTRFSLKHNSKRRVIILRLKKIIKKSEP